MQPLLRYCSIARGPLLIAAASTTGQGDDLESISLRDNLTSGRRYGNPEHHGRMKHLDRSFYWLRDQVIDRVIEPKYLPTDDNAADMLTKALAKPKVEKFRSIMGLVDRSVGK